MKNIGGRHNLLLLLSTFFFGGFEVLNAVPYDYTASAECLANPHKPQYGGGVIVNPELNEGLKGWSSFGNAKIQHRESKGNKFIVALGRNQQHASVSQKVSLQSGKLYTFSAWIQASKGGVPVTAMFKTGSGTYMRAGSIVAESNCWSMLKGGFPASASGPAELYFESKDTSVEIWVDSISLQPFTEEEWKSHQDQSIAKIRKSNVKIQAVDKQGKPLANAKISIQQKSPTFPFGCSLTKYILKNTAYQNWFLSRFTVATFGDEMKWYSTENTQGHEDYSVADAMLQFTKQHNIAVRGHNVFWDDPFYQLGWVKSLSPQQLASATQKRLNSVMNKYKGQLIGWDVVNENLHFNFFESKMGANASALFYNWAIRADAATTLFLNEYNTIEESADEATTPTKYLRKLKEMRTFPGNERGRFAIGLESHFTTPNIPYIRSSIDTLAAAGVPIWITELDVANGPKQTLYLEQILRETYAHPHIQGIVLWAGPTEKGCYRMCLTDNINFKNLPNGDVVDKLIHEWGLKGLVSGTTDAKGFFEAPLSHGDYEVSITHPTSKSSSLVQRLNVKPTASSQKPLFLKFSS